MLTGQRELEIAHASWPEIGTLDNPLLTIPASRMKGSRTHEVPLTPKAVDILAATPLFSAGDYVFTTTAGSTINGFSKAKKRIDKQSGVTGWSSRIFAERYGHDFRHFPLRTSFASW